MSIVFESVDILQFLRADCRLHGRGRKKWWAERLGVTPMMVSHWLTGRRLPSAPHLSRLYFASVQMAADKQKPGFSNYLWWQYYEGRGVDPFVLRHGAERLLACGSLSLRLLALLCWLFREHRPKAYKPDELPLADLWQNRLGWLYETAGLDAGFNPRALNGTGALLDASMEGYGPDYLRYLLERQTPTGAKWNLYDCSVEEAVRVLNSQHRKRY